jgi:hypothetical protein
LRLVNVPLGWTIHADCISECTELR